jgi:hypothetical protein
MITNIINPILIFIQTLLFPFWKIIMIFGVGYVIYWIVKYELSSEEKETSFKNELFKKTVIHWELGSFFVGLSMALIIQHEETRYIHLTFPLISLSVPLLALFGLSIRITTYEIWKLIHHSTKRQGGAIMTRRIGNQSALIAVWGLLGFFGTYAFITKTNSVTTDVLLAVLGFGFAFVTFQIKQLEDVLNKRIDDHITSGHPKK